MRILLIVVALLSAAAAQLAPAAAAEPRRPNIILIMSDDMGYSDLGCYGGEIETPNLDALARGGVRFTQFYNTARCCPTRAALLTGLYSHQAGIGHMTEDKGVDGYRGDLNKRCVTIAEALRPAGYKNYMIGKWHVTKSAKPMSEADKHNWPLQRGFDRFYGTIHGAGSFFDPNTLTRDNTEISAYADKEYQPGQFYYTDALSDQASRFIAEHKREAEKRDGAKQPFFMYVAYTAAHWPMHAKPADIAKYRGRYDVGYDAVRAARVEKLKRLGLLDSRWQVAAQDGGNWNDVKNREYETRCMEVYAAMVDCMDQGIGRIVAELKKQGELDNTLIFFLQDNGGCAEPMGRDPKQKVLADAATIKPLTADYLQPDMIPKQTRDGRPMRQGYGILPGDADTYAGYGRAWANVSNTPFREYKHWEHEGGISTPLIMHWPAGLTAVETKTEAKDEAEGRLFREPAHLIDLMATCVDVAGAQYPQTHAGKAITPLEGVSLRPALSDASLNRKQPIFFEHEGNRAVRDGRWKLVAKGPAGAWELYDMESDRTEQHDLATAEPERLAAMVGQWEAWANRAQVLPWIWKPAYGEPAVAVGGAKKPGKKKRAAN
ncbi:MAG: arylsulfatase [Pirellula sp.]|nr:arylsulfatase [Pirellula sp.]